MPESSTTDVAGYAINGGSSRIRVWSNVGYITKSYNCIELQTCVFDQKGVESGSVRFELSASELRKLADTLQNAADEHERRQNKFDTDYAIECRNAKNPWPRLI